MVRKSARNAQTHIEAVMLATEPTEVTEIDKEAIAVSVDAENYAAMNNKQLRVICTQAGIVWRNAHGKNRHLRKSEMISLLA